MLRHGLIFLLLSIIVVLFSKYLTTVVVYIDYCYITMNYWFTPLFSNSGIGIVLRKVVVLICVPLTAVGVPALIYRGIKGKDLPYTIQIAWILWSIIVLSNFLIR